MIFIDPIYEFLFEQSDLGIIIAGVLVVMLLCGLAAIIREY